MSARRPRRHEFDGRPYREMPFFDLITGYEWVPAALYAVLLVVLFAIDGFLNHLDTIAGGCC